MSLKKFMNGHIFTHFLLISQTGKSVDGKSATSNTPGGPIAKPHFDSESLEEQSGIRRERAPPGTKGIMLPLTSLKEKLLVLSRFWKTFIVLLVPLICLPVLFEGKDEKENLVRWVVFMLSKWLFNFFSGFPMCLRHDDHGFLLGH